MAKERVLTRRELNRALLERQLLLERKALSPVKAVERLGGLQAQSTTSPYLSLWTRLEGFERDQLVRALKARRLVKAIIQRGTLHMVTPSDYWAFATARRELGGILWPPSYEARLPTARLAQLALSVAAELDGSELTFKEVRALLELYEKPGLSSTFIWRRIQGRAYVVHVPPSGIWGYGGQGVYTAAQGKVSGGPPPPEDAFDQLVRSYLAAYGPATKPSTRIVACTIPLFVTIRDGGTSARIRDRSACERTRLSKRGIRRTGAGVSASGSGARGRS